MLLAIDIGNTNTVVGVYDGESLVNYFRVASAHNLTSDEAGLFMTGLLERIKVAADQISQVVIASVVPQLTPVYEQASQRYFNAAPLIVSCHIKLPITIEIHQPDQVGADRLANGAAAYKKYGGPVIVVDFGTATNFDVVNEKGAYIGGVIIPGPQTSLTELARKAARLFEVRIEPPEAVVGKSTAGALKSGLFYGTVGQVDYIIEKIIAETGFKNPTVVATGGLAEGIEKHSRYISRIDPTITLDGLRLIAAMN